MRTFRFLELRTHDILVLTDDPPIWTKYPKDGSQGKVIASNFNFETELNAARAINSWLEILDEDPEVYSS